MSVGISYWHLLMFSNKLKMLSPSNGYRPETRLNLRTALVFHFQSARGSTSALISTQTQSDCPVQQRRHQGTDDGNRESEKTVERERGHVLGTYSVTPAAQMSTLKPLNSEAPLAISGGCTIGASRVSFT